MKRFTLSFESRLHASPQELWAWATSASGILAELRPLVRMTIPRGVESILDLHVELGKPLVRSWMLLFGCIPLDRSELTLVELHRERGFVEESPMLGLRYWRHERTLEPMADGCKITDRLTFEPRIAGRLNRWFISMLFRHRHQVLRRRFGQIGT